MAGAPERVIWAPRAQRDIREIWIYYASEASVEVAERMIRAVETAAIRVAADERDLRQTQPRLDCRRIDRDCFLEPLARCVLVAPRPGELGEPEPRRLIARIDTHDLFELRVRAVDFAQAGEQAGERQPALLQMSNSRFFIRAGIAQTSTSTALSKRLKMAFYS